MYSCMGKLMANGISSACDTFATCHSCIELTYISGVILIFYTNLDVSHLVN